VRMDKAASRLAQDVGLPQSSQSSFQYPG